MVLKITQIEDENFLEEYAPRENIEDYLRGEFLWINQELLDYLVELQRTVLDGREIIAKDEDIIMWMLDNSSKFVFNWYLNKNWTTIKLFDFVRDKLFIERWKLTEVPKFTREELIDLISSSQDYVKYIVELDVGGFNDEQYDNTIKKVVKYWTNMQNEIWNLNEKILPFLDDKVNPQVKLRLLAKIWSAISNIRINHQNFDENAA
jgi:hypothetical protein